MHICVCVCVCVCVYGGAGIAGGTILGPVLLQLGMLPIVSTTTSGFTVPPLACDPQ